MDDPVIEVVTEADDGLVDEVARLVKQLQMERSTTGLSEARLRALQRASIGPGSHYLGVTARDGNAGTLVGYAQIDDEGDRNSSTLEFVLGANMRASDHGLDQLLDCALAAFTVAGGGTIRLWVNRPDASDDHRVAALGFTMERELLQLRCTLPLADASPASRADKELTTRPFVVGADEQGWLIANNRAFAGHPEQGQWDLAALEARQCEPWFNPEGFRILEVNGRIVGSCWTKIHPDADPPMGEIYVISVDPDAHGRGWGRALTRDGLEWLAAQGLHTGMLYVDAGNTAAVTLYRSMGFTSHHFDRCYVLDAPLTGTS